MSNNQDNLFDISVYGSNKDKFKNPRNSSKSKSITKVEKNIYCLETIAS